MVWDDAVCRQIGLSRKGRRARQGSLMHSEVVSLMGEKREHGKHGKSRLKP